MVSQECGVDFHHLMSNRRYARVVEARWLTFFLARIHTKDTLVQIGHLVGGRDHSTVIHGLRKMRWRIANDPALAMHIETLHVKLHDLQRGQKQCARLTPPLPAVGGPA
jgi:chromosomal replication initiator protein